MDTRLLAEYKYLLGREIAQEVSASLRINPTLDETKVDDALETLVNDTTMRRLIEELAQEAIVDAMDEGKQPSDALMFLAGFSPSLAPAY